MSKVPVPQTNVVPADVFPIEYIEGKTVQELVQITTAFLQLGDDKRRNVLSVHSNYPSKLTKRKSMEQLLELHKHSVKNYNSTVHKLPKLLEKYEANPRFTPEVRRHLTVAHKLEAALKNHFDFSNDLDLVPFLDGAGDRSDRASVLTGFDSVEAMKGILPDNTE